MWFSNAVHCSSPIVPLYIVRETIWLKLINLHVHVYIISQGSNNQRATVSYRNTNVKSLMICIVYVEIVIQKHANTWGTGWNLFERKTEFPYNLKYH